MLLCSITHEVLPHVRTSFNLLSCVFNHRPLILAIIDSFHVVEGVSKHNRETSFQFCDILSIYPIISCMTASPLSCVQLFKWWIVLCTSHLCALLSIFLSFARSFHSLPSLKYECFFTHYDSHLLLICITLYIDSWHLWRFGYVALESTWNLSILYHVPFLKHVRASIYVDVEHWDFSLTKLY